MHQQGSSDDDERLDRIERWLVEKWTALRSWYESLTPEQKRSLVVGTAAAAGSLASSRRSMMAKKVFHSFYFKRDAQRVSQVRNMGVIEGQPVLSSNDWEDVKKGGDPAIKAWIDKQMVGKGCVVVLIGSQTAGRKWVNYEIVKGWNDRKGVVGVYLHNLKNLAGSQDSKGRNPFDDVTLGDTSTKLSSIVKAYDPPSSSSKSVYDYIKNHLEGWVDEAIEIRRAHG